MTKRLRKQRESRYILRVETNGGHTGYYYYNTELEAQTYIRACITEPQVRNICLYKKVAEKGLKCTWVNEPCNAE